MCPLLYIVIAFLFLFFFSGFPIAFHQKINYIANGSLLRACIKAPRESQKKPPLRRCKLQAAHWPPGCLGPPFFLGRSQTLTDAFFTSADVEGAWVFSIPQGSCILRLCALIRLLLLVILCFWEWVGCGGWDRIGARLSLFDLPVFRRHFKFFSFLLEWEWNLKFLAVSKYQLTKLKDSQNKQLSIPESYRRPGGLVNEARISSPPHLDSAQAAPALPRQRTHVCFVASR